MESAKVKNASETFLVIFKHCNFVGKTTKKSCMSIINEKRGCKINYTAENVILG